MRILYVLNGFDPGGAEHGLLALIENRAFDRHDLRVLAFCRGRGNLADKVVEALGRERVHFASTSERLTMYACMAGLVRILLVALCFRPEKMVLSLKQANLIGRSAALALPHITCVAFEHIAEYRARRLQGAYGPILYLLSWRVDEVWADCAETLRQTDRYFSRRRRVKHIIPLFVADPNGPCKADYPLASPLRLVAAGRLVARKNVALMVETVASLRDIGVDAVLDVYGDGPEWKAVEDLVAEQKLDGRVTLHGYREDWRAQVVRSDIFLNLSDTEGFCIVVAEAMVAGLPIIAVDVGGIRNYGVDGMNMMKLSDPNPEGIQAAILQLAHDDLLRERLGRQARSDMLLACSADVCRVRVEQAVSFG